MNDGAKAALGVAGIGAAALGFMYWRKIGLFSDSSQPFAPTDFGGGGLTPEQRKSLGSPMAAPVAQDDPAFIAAAKRYMSTWDRNTAQKQLRTLAPVGGYGVTILVKTETPILYQADMVNDQNPEHAARGFTLNDVQPAVYSGDCWRAWGMVIGERVGNNARGATGYECDLFVTPATSQKLASSGLLRGSGKVYCWDPIEKRWLKPDEYRFRPNPIYFRSGLGVNDGDIEAGYAYRVDLVNRKSFTRYFRSWTDVLRTVRNSRTKDRPW
jgi:hypothetical protein